MESCNPDDFETETWNLDVLATDFRGMNSTGRNCLLLIGNLADSHLKKSRCYSLEGGEFREYVRKKKTMELNS